MPAKAYPIQKVEIAKGSNPVSVFVSLEDKTDGSHVMGFTAECNWKYHPSGEDPDPSKPSGSDSLDDLEALIKLGPRPSQFNASRVDVAVTCGSLEEKEHTYAVSMSVRQAAVEVYKFDTGDRKFKGVDVFTSSFVFVHKG